MSFMLSAVFFYCYAECLHAESSDVMLSAIMINVVMLSVIGPMGIPSKR